MATIPRLNRVEPGRAVPQNDRINMKVGDNSAMILQNTQALTGLAKEGANIYQEYENQKIEQLSSQAEIEFDKWNNSELEKLKGWEGDPTVAYNEYDKRVQEKREELLTGVGDVPERVKRHYTSRLDKVLQKNEVVALKQRGYQQEVYANNLFETSVKTKKESLPAFAGMYNVNDPSSTLTFDQGLADIKTTIVKRALEKGGAERLPDDAEKAGYVFTDDEGNQVKVNLNPITKQRIAKELSEGVKSSLDAMIVAGQVEEAKAFRERYKGYLDPKNLSAVDKQLNKELTSQEAYNFISGLRGKSPEDQITAIENLPEGELRDQVIKIKETNDRKLERLKDLRAEGNYNTLASHVLKRQSSGNPYDGIADLESDPVFKNTWDNMNANQQKAVMEMVKAPKTSNDKSVLKVNQLLLGEIEGADLDSMSLEQFHSEYLVGLNQKDKNKYINDFRKLKDPSQAQKRVMYKEAGKFLQDYLISEKYIRRNDYDKIRGSSETKLIQAREKLIDALSTQGNLDTKQLKDFVKEFAAAEIKGEVFNPAPRTPARTVSNRSSTSNRDIGNMATYVKDLRANDLAKLNLLKREFKNINKRFPTDTDEDFLLFVKSKS